MGLKMVIEKQELTYHRVKAVRFAMSSIYIWTKMDRIIYSFSNLLDKIL